MTSELWAPRANHCAMPVWVLLLFRVARTMTIGFCKPDKWWLPARWFEHLTSGLWAPRAHRCATSVRVCSSALMHHCDVMINTGGTFRSYDLEVMSPARCLCATPVNCCSCLGSLELWPSVSVNPTKDEYRKLDSNQRPRDYESRALPLRHPGRIQDEGH